jgi:hypothetical protein
LTDTYCVHTYVLKFRYLTRQYTYQGNGNVDINVELNVNVHVHVHVNANANVYTNTSLNINVLVNINVTVIDNLAVYQVTVRLALKSYRGLHEFWVGGSTKWGRGPLINKAQVGSRLTLLERISWSMTRR